MNRMRLAALLFCLLLLIVFFNYIYVCSTRTKMLDAINQLCEQSDTLGSPEPALRIWKNRKWLLSLSLPLTVLDQIDMQLTVADACLETGDYDAYLRAIYRLRELVASLSG